MRRYIRQQKNRGTGFSLVEVIVAIYILIVGILGVMTLTITTTKAGALSSSKLIAANLAQEGIEVVKNIRDLNYENPAGCGWTCWHEAVSEAVSSGPVNYIVQYNDTELRTYIGTPPSLLYNSATGLYSYDSGSASKYNFKRIITLADTIPPASGTSTKVISTVTWTENGQTQPPLVVEDDLWNWR